MFKSECCGLFGLLFGHKVKSMTIKESSGFPVSISKFTIPSIEMFPTDFVRALHRTERECVPICKRCGKKF